MADTPIPGETATPGDVKNDVSASAPVVDNASTAEVERLRKDAEQARMRANQLQNELEAKNRAEDEARQRQLEEQAEFKQLYEQSNAELKRLREEREATERQAELNNQTQSILKDYPEAVVKAAQIAGISLTDDSEVAHNSLRSKLDALKETVAPGAAATPVSSSNPAATSSAAGASAPDGPLGRPRSLGIDNGSTPVNPVGDNKKMSQYLGGLKSVEAMKMSSGYYAEK